MAVRQMKRCPHCGKIYDDIAVGKQRMGSPFRVCEKCHGTFYDSSYVEIAFGDVDTSTINSASTGSLIMGGFLCVVGFIMTFIMILSLISNVIHGVKIESDEVWGVVVCLVIYIPFIIAFIKYCLSGAKRRRELEVEMRASEERIANPDYVRKLILNGYKVPKGYLKLFSQEPKR